MVQHRGLELESSLTAPGKNGASVRPSMTRTAQSWPRFLTSAVHALTAPQIVAMMQMSTLARSSAISIDVQRVSEWTHKAQDETPET
jgi:hypothetical protein